MKVSSSQSPTGFRSWSRRNSGKVLSITLVLAMLIALAVLGYIRFKPNVAQNFTEFYLLGQENTTEIKVGKTTEVTIGIVNNEHKMVTYRITIVIDDVINNEVDGIVLSPDATWENKVNFTPKTPKTNSKIEFYLYKSGQVSTTIEPLQLRVNVIR